ncbi:hypothetical protein Hanom_Chr03g00240371 [Helianthus anomalus]
MITTYLYTQGLVVADIPSLLWFWDVIVKPGAWDNTLSKWRISAVIDLTYKYVRLLLLLLSLLLLFIKFCVSWV